MALSSKLFLIVLTTVFTWLKDKFFSNLFSIMLVWNEKWKVGEKMGPNHNHALSKFVL